MAYRAVVAIDDDRVTSFEACPGAQPNVTIDEYHEADVALRKDPRVREVLAARGITDLDLVLIDTWAFGAHLLPEEHQTRRLGWADVWRRAEHGANPYANPVDGPAPHRRHGHARARRHRGRRGDRRAGADGRVRRQARPRADGARRPAALRGQPASGRLVHARRQPAAVGALVAARRLQRPRGARRCTRSAGTTATACAASRTGCRSPRWSSRTATPRPTTSAARRSTSASGGWAS